MIGLSFIILVKVSANFEYQKLIKSEELRSKRLACYAHMHTQKAIALLKRTIVWTSLLSVLRLNHVDKLAFLNFF